MTVTHTILRNAHIAGGLLTLVAGAAAMTFQKGSPLHRRAGNDARMIARGGLTGTARTTRHLWRMSLSFFMATASFFFGQPRFVPIALRETALYIVAGLLPLGLMLFWLIRVRIWPSLRKRLSLRVA